MNNLSILLTSVINQITVTRIEIVEVSQSFLPDLIESGKTLIRK